MEEPGSGAAGGPGFGAQVFPGAGLLPGFTLVANSSYLGLRQAIAQRQRIITGEERLDGSVLSGKVIGGPTQLAEPVGVPMIAFWGTLNLSASQCRQPGLYVAQSIVTGPMESATALQRAPQLLTDTRAVLPVSCPHPDQLPPVRTKLKGRLRRSTRLNTLIG